jgi:hypothetical protein
MKVFALTLSGLAALLDLAATLPTLINELEFHPYGSCKLGTEKLRPPAM